MPNVAAMQSTYSRGAMATKTRLFEPTVFEVIYVMQMPERGQIYGKSETAKGISATFFTSVQELCRLDSPILDPSLLDTFSCQYTHPPITTVT